METEQILELDRNLRTALGGKVAGIPDDMLAVLEQLAGTIGKVLLEVRWLCWKEGEFLPFGTH